MLHLVTASIMNIIFYFCRNSVERYKSIRLRYRKVVFFVLVQILQIVILE